MLGTRTMESLTREAEKAGAKLVLVGDPQQVQTIEAGAPFALTQTHHFVALNHIRRQTTPLADRGLTLFVQREYR